MLVLALALAPACGGAPARPAEHGLVPPPTRTAAQDRSVRSLLLDLAAAQLCKRLTGTFVALPDSDAATGPAAGASPSAGRLWIEHCEATRHDNKLALRLAGRGWTWVEKTAAGPMGTSFTVRGQLKFRSSVDLLGAIDLAYAEDARRVTLWVTPPSPADAHVVPTGAVPVAPNGGWSTFVAALGSALGASAADRARPMVEQQGSAQMADRLSRGFTFTVDLCTGQSDSIVGPLGNGEMPRRPWPEDGKRWLDNQRVRLRKGGLDAAGPFTSSDGAVHLDLAVEHGPGVSVELLCADDAHRVLAAWLAGGDVPSPRPLAEQTVSAGVTTFVEVDARSCPVVALVRPAASTTDATPVVYRYRVYVRGDDAAPVVRCR